MIGREDAAGVHVLQLQVCSVERISISLAQTGLVAVGPSFQPALPRDFLPVREQRYHLAGVQEALELNLGPLGQWVTSDGSAPALGSLALPESQGCSRQGSSLALSKHAPFQGPKDPQGYH